MEYPINKGAGNPVEFKGLKSQYLFVFAGGMVTVLLAVVILYLAGVDQWICIPFGTVSGGLLAWAVFRLNARYGEHGLMKLLAEKRRPLRAGAMHQQNWAALLRQPGGGALGLTTAKTNICRHQNGKRGQHVGFLFGKQAGINYTHYPALCLVAGWQ